MQAADGTSLLGMGQVVLNEIDRQAIIAEGTSVPGLGEKTTPVLVADRLILKYYAKLNILLHKQ